MHATGLIKDGDFRLVTEFAKTDAKKRVSLGGALLGTSAFNIYKNALGQIVLDPVKAVPASEMWLYENPKALASVKNGLKEAGEGNLISRSSFAHHVKD